MNDQEIFNLLIETFEKLNNYTLDPRHYSLIYLSFVWNFFAILGYQPQLYNCANCHNKLLDESNLFFSYKEGGTTCPDCGKIKKHIKVDSSIIKILRIILKQDWQTLQKIKITTTTLKQLNNISKNYYLYILSSHSFKK